MALIGSLDSGISALKSFSKGIEVIGDAIANVNSLGYKGSRVDYTDGFSNILSRSTASPTGQTTGSNSTTSQIGSGTQIAAISTDYSQGTSQPTESNSDLAIIGKGFFKVQNSISGAEFATRAGNFRIDDRNYVVTHDGLRLQGVMYDAGSLPTYSVTYSNGEAVFTQVTPATSPPTGAIGDLKTEISFSTGAGNLINNTGGSLTDAQIDALDTIPKFKDFEFGQNGELKYIMSTGGSFEAGQLLLLNFSDPQALVRESNGRFTGFGAAGATSFTQAAGKPSTNALGTIKARTLELSNVDLTQKFADIITTQRSFQAGARIISTSDEILNEIVNLKR